MLILFAIVHWVACQRAEIRSVPMKQKPKSWRIIIYTGSGMAIGAALGLIFGMMLFEHAVVGPLAGAAIGAVISLVWGLQGGRRQTQ